MMTRVGDSLPPSVDEVVLKAYREIVRQKHPTRVGTWPIISGSNVRIGNVPGGIALIYNHTGSTVTSVGGIGDLPVETGNSTMQRIEIEKLLHLGPRDGAVVLERGADGYQDATGQLAALLLRHEIALGLAPMRIFLSHKGVDKEMVRRFERILRELGFDPWLDEDAMPAGVNPDRAILQGFKDSCAAVFFVTPDFKDESWLANEIELARGEKREKDQRFAIITLRFSKDSQQGVVPELLKKHFIYKEPKHELEALVEIIRALPITVGAIHFR